MGGYIVNWDAIGAVGEIVGALAVVASLGYLAIQVRAQNRESRLAAMHDVTTAYRETLANISDENIASVVSKAIDDSSSLPNAERLQLIGFVSNIFRIWEEAYLLHEAGRLDLRIWQTMLRQFNGYLGIKPFAEVWAIRKQYFDDEFREFVDSQAREEYEFELPDMNSQKNT